MSAERLQLAYQALETALHCAISAFQDDFKRPLYDTPAPWQQRVLPYLAEQREALARREDDRVFTVEDLAESALGLPPVFSEYSLQWTTPAARQQIDEALQLVVKEATRV